MTARWQEPFSREEIRAMRRAHGDDPALGNDFWRLIRRVGRNLPFAEDAMAIFYCALDPATSPRAKAIVLGAVAYFVMPFDIIPDFIPILGFTDDAAVIAAAVAAVRAELTEDHKDRARKALADQDT
jgi:uncharacterized membrane protein YkvA (DUF1232 family)